MPRPSTCRPLTSDVQHTAPNDPAVALSLDKLAALYHVQARYDLAAPLYKEALAIAEEALDGGHPFVAAALGNLARLHADQNLFAEAERYYLRALSAWEEVEGAGRVNLAETLEGYAAMLRAVYRVGEADDVASRARTIRANQDAAP